MLAIIHAARCLAYKKGLFISKIQSLPMLPLFLSRITFELLSIRAKYKISKNARISKE
jgi:hypothetical protein